MKHPTQPTDGSLPHGDAAYVTEAARGIATGQLLVADLSNSSWVASLALMMDKLAEIPNLGLILVPLTPHAHLHWINGTAPGITMQAQLVAIEDLEALDAEVTRMNQALHPQQHNKEKASMKLNNKDVTAGLFVDGDEYQDRAEDRLADLAVEYGLTLDDDSDPRHWRTMLEGSKEMGDGMDEVYSDKLDESITKLIEMMNRVTEGGRFEWEDGDVFLIEDQPERA